MTGRKHRRGGERFVKLPHWMLKCSAWRTLSPSANAVRLHLWERHNGSNNGDIAYAVRDAEDEATGIGLSKDQASHALAELVERGFLCVVRNSAFKVKTKEAHTWTLTAEPVGGKPATRDGRPLRFGDDAKARRTARTPSVGVDVDMGGTLVPPAEVLAANDGEMKRKW